MVRKIDFVLINPPSPPGYTSNKDMMGGFGQLYAGIVNDQSNKIPPIDLAYICAQCKKDGFEFLVIDGLVENVSFKNIINRIEENIPRYVFIRTSTSSFKWDLSLAKQIYLETNLKVIFFGPHVNQKREECIGQNEVFAIILSEPERVIPELLKNNIERVYGVWFKKNRTIIRNRDTKLIENLDSLEFPAWEFFPYLDYGIGKQIRDKTPFVTVLTSRGCPFQCIYCPYPLGQGTNWRSRSAENVILELKYLKKNFDVNGVLFRDAVFTLDKKRTKDICQQIIKNNIKISWRCETRLDCLDLKLLEIMKKSGMIGLNIGIESFSENVLNNLRTRTIDKKTVKKFAKFCDKNKVDLFLFFIIGLPEETKNSLLSTINFVRNLNVRDAQFTIATPYPGTELEKWAKEKKYLLNEDQSKITGYSCTMRNEFLGPKSILLLYKYANISVQLGLKNIFRRIKKEGVKQIIKEMAKCSFSLYYYLKLKMTSSKK